jgi:ADP-ribose pyrophosphatase YjhB (NUDIX family)
MSCVAEKVTALIVRETEAGRQVLLFRHPTAGVQAPAGTVEEGEAPEVAALREGREESGLSGLAVVRHLGTRESAMPEGEGVLGRTVTAYARPDPGSWDWASIQRGLRVNVLRREGDWAQVDFREWNRFPDPEFVSYRITGWIPADAICETVRRHFYLLTPTEPTPDDEWAVNIDNHIFRPFWTSLAELFATDAAMILEPQRHWIDSLRDAFDA